MCVFLQDPTAGTNPDCKFSLGAVTMSTNEIPLQGKTTFPYLEVNLDDFSHNMLQ